VEGEIVEGTVKNLTDYGAFVDLAESMVFFTSPILRGEGLGIPRKSFRLGTG